MIKVCHITSAHRSEDIRIFHKECVSLAKNGYDVYLVQQGEDYEKNGVHLIGFGGIPSSRFQRMLFGAKRAYKKALAVDADIYHLHDPELLPYGLKLRRKGKKVIFDSHEYYTSQIAQKSYIPQWIRLFTARSYHVYEKYVLKRIDGVIFPCLKDGKHPFEGLCRHIATLNNLPLLEELYEQYDASVQKEERSIVYIGSLEYTRGVTHLILAAGKAGCTVLLGGIFHSAAYRTEIESLPEYCRVQYLGPVSRSQVLETLQKGQIGMANIHNVGQYNQFDNLSTKVYEYMSLGLPVILTRAPYNERIMERLQFGICVDPENVDEISSAITYLLDHPEEARRMGENGRRAVKEELNWGVEEKKLLALYEEILKE